jgi:DNA invertase Pin-like site-specific DNA recombinase
MKTAVAYTRVSTKEQQEDGFSLPAQRGLLDSYAAKEGIKIVERFEDSDTAKQAGKRPAFTAMLAYLQEHPTCRTILVEKTDRLYRNLKDWIKLDELGAELHFVKEGSTISPASHSSQKFLHGIKVLMAKNYVENLSEEIKKGMREKAKEGGYPTHAPIGYLNTDAPEGIVPDPAMAPVVQHLFQEAATGRHSCQDLTRRARDLGVRTKRGNTLSKNALRENILTNPAYYGTFRWAGTTYEGRYEPLITKEVFDSVQHAVIGTHRPRPRSHTFTYTGILRCGTCNGTLSGDRKKGRYIYYMCNGTNGCRHTITERAFDDATTRLLEHLHLPGPVADWLTEELTNGYDETSTETQEERSRVQKRVTEVTGLQARAYEDKLTGTIPIDFWMARNKAMTEELDTLRSRLRALDDPPSRDEFLRAALDPIELLQTAREAWVMHNDEEKALLVKTLVSNYTVTDGTISVSMRSPFDLLARGLESGDWWS